jgi:CheY-like chemotaxis protein
MANVLLVDDEAIIRMAFAEHLRDNGFAPIEAGSGEEALKVLRNGAQADVVITDLTLDGQVDGAKLIRSIQSEYPSIPIIVISGDPSRLQGLQVTQTFLKPFGFDVAIAAIKRLID